MSRWRYAVPTLLALTIVGRAGTASADHSDEDVRRLLTLLSAVGEEYREGVQDGAVVRPNEFEEAKSFLEDAGQRFRAVARDLPSPGNDVDKQFADLSAAIDRHAPVEIVSSKLLELRQRVAALTGVKEQVYPPGAPSAARGKPLFQQYCATCHGERGDGKGPSAANLNPPPRNFADSQFMRGETPYDFYHVISLGRRNTAMPAWDGVLSVQDRWDLISYLWTLAPGATRIAEGQGIYLAQCAGCHGATGDGHGTFGPVLVQAVPDLTQPQVLARRTDADLLAAVTNGVAATPMPAFSRTLSEDERWKAVAFVRSLSLGGPGAPTTSTAGGGTKDDSVLGESAKLLDAALAAYARGDTRAAALAGDAYLEFEPLETRLAATDPGLKTRVEERFLHLRQTLRTPAADAEIHTLSAALHADLSAVRTALQPHTSLYALFIESATIILREGLEIVLVIGALIAYVVKTGNAAMGRAVRIGVAVGIIASLLTALVMGEMFRLHPGSSDVLEGITMLLAAAVLFWVSYWLVSKAAADRWQQYIRGKVQGAVRRGGGVALAGAAFLAVYREGFETVLFYQALYASAPEALWTLTAGFMAGAVILAVVYLLFRRFEVQIPIRQFFFVTGSLLYCLAAIFAGQGVHELQEAGIIALTPVAWMPTIPLLGVFPSVQSLAVQGLFIALLIYATVVTVRRSRTVAAEEQADAALAELRAVRLAIEALRPELEALRRSTASTPVASVADRVDELLIRVEALTVQVGAKQPVPINRREGP